MPASASLYIEGFLKACRGQGDGSVVPSPLTVLYRYYRINLGGALCLEKPESGIYHVMLRGIDRQLIFEDSEDYMRFLDIVQECRQLCNFKLYAYCLMGNHVHLLLRVQEESLETVFKRIGGG